MRLNFQGFNKVWFREKKKKDSIYQMSFTLNHSPQELTMNRWHCFFKKLSNITLSFVFLSFYNVLKRNNSLQNEI